MISVDVGAGIALDFRAPIFQIAARLEYDSSGDLADKKKQIGVDIDGDIGFVDIRGWDQLSEKSNIIPITTDTTTITKSIVTTM
jgi:hypothetical protein